MVRKINIGVIGIQGAVSEHVSIMKKVFSETNTPGEVFIIHQKEQLDAVNGLILPGGESTTISKILIKTGLQNEIKSRIKKQNIAIMGTCAGCVLLADNISDEEKEIKPLGAIDITVRRNAFGRQRESFEQEIHISGFDKTYSAVFIRAPIIEKVGDNCKVLAKIDNKIVMVKQGKILALSFHPELTEDLRIHKYFLDII